MNSKSLAQIAYEEIKRKIIQGEFLPGHIISIKALGEQLNMSRTPIRDALLRIESEGFVITLKNRGILVKELSYKELFEIQELINCMHDFAVETVIERGHSFFVEELEQILEEQIQASNEGDYYKYIELAINFERCLIETSHNQIMLRVFDSIRDKYIQIAIVNWKLYPREKHYSYNKINSQILDAIIKNNYTDIKQIRKDYYLYNRERFIMKGRI